MSQAKSSLGAVQWTHTLYWHNSVLQRIDNMKDKYVVACLLLVFNIISCRSDSSLKNVSFATIYPSVIKNSTGVSSYVNGLINHFNYGPTGTGTRQTVLPQDLIRDIWHTISHYWTRNDLNSQERLEDIGQDILSGFNEREKSTVYFYLYNRNREGSYLIKYGALDQLRKSTFVKGLPVKFLIHGFKMNGFSHFSYLLTEAYMKHGKEANVFSVDWRRLAGDYVYFNAAFNTRIVGERIGELIVFLKQNGFIDSYDSIHLIGFSLGAHVAGYTAKYIIKTERQHIGRITGLDPAGPAFSGTDPNNRLDKGDAKFVDIIHTSIQKSGIVEAIGHVDFFPNGGIDQPGCEWELLRDFFLRNCSHERAFYLYLETIRGKKFIGCACKSWEDFQTAHCNCDETSTGSAIMGEHCNKTARGKKYLNIPGTFPSAPVVKSGI